MTVSVPSPGEGGTVEETDERTFDMDEVCWVACEVEGCEWSNFGSWGDSYDYLRERHPLTECPHPGFDRVKRDA